MAHVARQTRLTKEPPIFLDPLRIHQLLAQFQESEPGTAPRLDVVADQMNDIRDRDRFSSQRIKMRRHPLQQHERVVIDLDDVAARADEARRLGVEPDEIGQVTDDKGRNGEIVSPPGETGCAGIAQNRLS